MTDHDYPDDHDASPWCGCDRCAEGPDDDRWIEAAYERDAPWQVDTRPHR